MDLILWRHAEAEDGVPDQQRALTPKGKQQALQMAQWLEPKLPSRLRILCSPARRTVQTVEALGRSYHVVYDVGTGATPKSVLAAANWPAGPETVLIVGHQPTLGQVAALLIGGSAQYWTVRKGNVWWISRHDQEGGGANFIRAVMAPELAGK